LEKETGKTYEEIVGDFNKKIVRNSTLEKRNKTLAKKIKSTKKAHTRKLDNYNKTKNNLEHLIETKTGIHNIGLKEYAKIVTFKESFQALGLNIEEVKELDNIKHLLNQLNIKTK
jgi:hypothetical protein